MTKYVFHIGRMNDCYGFVTDFDGMAFEAENDQAAFDHVSDLSTQEDEKVLAEIEAGRLDKHAYDNLAVLLDYLFRVNGNGTEDNIGAVETGREEPSRTLYLDRLTDAQKAEFIDGWKNAGGDMSDLESPNPWCEPWNYQDSIDDVKGDTPAEWGAFWWEENRAEIEKLIAEEKKAQENAL